MEIDMNRNSKVAKELLSYIEIIMISLLIALFLVNFVIINARIPSNSMLNGIAEGDRLIGFRLSYLFSDPKRGDVVIFKNPDDESETFIKRVIGTPGDKVEIKAGILYINDEVIQEDYIREPMWEEDYGPYFVPNDCYFMLGDNRNYSKDSRKWTTTPFVAKKKILGKAIFKYYDSIEFIK